MYWMHAISTMQFHHKHIYNCFWNRMETKCLNCMAVVANTIINSFLFILIVFNDLQMCLQLHWINSDNHLITFKVLFMLFFFLFTSSQFALHSIDGSTFVACISLISKKLEKWFTWWFGIDMMQKYFYGKIFKIRKILYLSIKPLVRYSLSLFNIHIHIKQLSSNI